MFHDLFSFYFDVTFEFVKSSRQNEQMSSFMFHYPFGKNERE